MDGRGPPRPGQCNGGSAALPRPAPQARLRRFTTGRRGLAFVIALVAGLGIALIDSGRGFDATGITAVGLIGAGTVVTLVEGTGSFAWAAVLIAVVGGWIPLIESQSLPASGFALVLAAIGGFAGAWSARLRRTGEDL